MSTDPTHHTPHPPGDRGRAEGRRAQDDGWGAFGLLVAGVAVWGGAGYLVSRWLNNQLFVMLGLLLGMGTALYGVWFRYGRS